MVELELWLGLGLGLGLGVGLGLGSDLVSLFFKTLDFGVILLFSLGLQADVFFAQLPVFLQDALKHILLREEHVLTVLSLHIGSSRVSTCLGIGLV